MGGIIPKNKGSKSTAVIETPKVAEKKLDNFLQEKIKHEEISNSYETESSLEDSLDISGLEFDPDNLTLTQNKEYLPAKRSQFKKTHGIDLFVTVMCITKHGFSEVVGTYFPMDIVNLVMELFYLLHGKNFTDIKCGSFHSFALITGSKLYGWGCNRYGQLGLGQTHNALTYTRPQRIEIDNIRKVACGDTHTMILAFSGLYGCGNNKFGQLGLGHFDEGDMITPNSSPKKIENLNNVTTFTCGHYHTIAKVSNGAVYAWGKNDSGQLGIGGKDNCNTPMPIISPEGVDFNTVDIISMGCGLAHSMMATDVGFFGWGRNTSGQLGLGDESSRDVPTKVTSLPNINIIAIRCGSRHTMCLTSNDELYCAGENRFGQLGLGDYVNRTIFTKINLSQILSFSLGASFSLIVTKNGLFGCGKNDYGQLAKDPRETNRMNTPTLIKKKARFRFLGCGYHHSIVVDAVDSHGWGRNDYGQLGFKSEMFVNYEFTPKESDILKIIKEEK